MSTDSWSISNPPVPDAEKGAAGLKAKTAEAAATATAEKDMAVVDARKARLIRLGLDVFFVVYLLFCVGMVALMVMVSDNWWDPWPGVAIVTPICIVTLWMTPMMKDVYIQLYATKRTPGSNSDLSTKLLAS